MREKKIVKRAYNEFYRGEWGVVTKQSDTSRMRDEIEYYLSIPERLKILFPRVLESDKDRGWMTMEWYDYPNLGEYMLDVMDAPLHYADWTIVMETLRDIIKKWSDYPQHNPDVCDAWKMYHTKTVRENTVFADQRIESRLFEGDDILINGGEYKTFQAIWPEVETFIDEVLLPTYAPGIIHGDMCLSNILCGNNMTLRFIDPRGSFGTQGLFGDPRYDVAKIYHSVDAGYEFFNCNKFTLYEPRNESESWGWGLGHNVKQGELNYNALMLEAKMRALSVFIDVFFEGNNSFSRKEITVIEGLIYIGAVARHYENPRRQVAMYLVGLQLLNKGMSL